MRSIVYCLGVLTFAMVSIAGAQTKPTTQNSQDEAGGKKLMQKVIDAHGGANAFAAINSIRTTTDSAARHSVSAMVLPDHFRGEIETKANNPANPGKKNITVIGPAGAWYFDGGTWRELPAQNRATSLRFASMNTALLLRDGLSGKYHLNLVGSDQLNGAAINFLEISADDGPKVRWLIDPASGEILARDDGSIRTTYDQWQTVAGVRLPMHLRSSNSATKQSSDATIKYEINPKLDGKEFDKPADFKSPPATRP